MSDLPARLASHNAAQLRLMDVMRALAGHEVFGLRLADLAKAVGARESMVLRDLQTMAHKGWAVQDATKAWRLGPEPVQIAVQFSYGLRQAQAKVSEVEQRYTRLPG
ncbi:MAG: helix-turn-helix domain-containing protein [Candidatus Accumulibacter sp.]|uniref:helix-turn-helix domain-containing protein n=1 Tax=Accumulibacter sp. TaxID=2053492 RepID=UPI001A4B36B3|nr:helix-turn-helix domain-containing protein [Accumulibacter sp.]MBL8396156.1 helix-turn-helix domain-containing protein [Accumulibacter sp.]